MRGPKLNFSDDQFTSAADQLVAMQADRIHSGKFESIEVVLVGNTMHDVLRVEKKVNAALMGRVRLRYHAVAVDSPKTAEVFNELKRWDLTVYSENLDPAVRDYLAGGNTRGAMAHRVV